MCALLLLLLLAGPAAAGEAKLRIEFIDVEGGQATLIVTPAGESMLVDAGWSGVEGRDAERIVAAMRRAGIERLDYVLATHYHRDHVGGVPALAGRVPVVTFVDYGDYAGGGKRGSELAAAYYAVREKGRHLAVKPGDRIPLEDVRIDVVAAGGRFLEEPLAEGGEPNPACGAEPAAGNELDENGRSVAFLLRYGEFRFADLGDLPSAEELRLVCPENKLGEVDLYLTTHHGVDRSGPPALLRALNPRVAIMNNGARKGGDPGAFEALAQAPGLEALWQVHYSLKAGKANAPDRRLGNIVEGMCGHSLLVEAGRDGSFTVVNLRTGYREHYPAPAKD